MSLHRPYRTKTIRPPDTPVAKIAHRPPGSLNTNGICAVTGMADLRNFANDSENFVGNYLDSADFRL